MLDDAPTWERLHSVALDALWFVEATTIMAADAVDEGATVNEDEIDNDVKSFEGHIVIEHLTPQQQAVLRDLFAVFDQMDRGFLNISDLRVALRMAGCEVSRDEAHALVSLHCHDREAGLTLQEFLGLCDELLAQRPQEFRSSFLQSAFDSIDVDGQGELDSAAIAKWARAVNDCEPDSFDASRMGSAVHAAPDYLDLPPLEMELSSAEGIERFMANLGLGPTTRISREAFMKLMLDSETIV